MTEHELKNKIIELEEEVKRQKKLNQKYRKKISYLSNELQTIEKGK
jgi:hypothetical protein